jgi:hypothetical protein
MPASGNNCRKDCSSCAGCVIWVICDKWGDFHPAPIAEIVVDFCAMPDKPQRKSMQIMILSDSADPRCASRPG